MLELAPVRLRLAENAAVITGLVANVDDRQARWRPSPDAWSLLEVVNHLVDEEREDFRMRLDYLLHRPGEPWPPIDPAGWVTARGYNQREVDQSLDTFLAERRASLLWLDGLIEPDWGRAEQHPVAGLFTAADMLSSWLAHDFLHIRQLNELHYQHHARRVAPARIDYAGDW